MRYLVKTERYDANGGKKLYPPPEAIGSHKGMSVGEDGIVSEVVDTDKHSKFAGLTIDEISKMYEEVSNSILAGSGVVSKVVSVTKLDTEDSLEDIAKLAFTVIDWMDSIETLLNTPDVGANDSTPEQLEKAYFNNTLVIGNEWCGCAERKELEKQEAGFDDTYYFRDRETGSHGWACLWCNKIIQSG